AASNPVSPGRNSNESQVVKSRADRNVSSAFFQGLITLCVVMWMAYVRLFRNLAVKMWAGCGVHRGGFLETIRGFSKCGALAGFLILRSIKARSGCLRAIFSV